MAFRFCDAVVAKQFNLLKEYTIMKHFTAVLSLAALAAFSTPLLASEKTAVFHGSPDTVFTAAEYAAQKWWALSFADRSTHLISFDTGRSFFSHGMECGVTFRPINTNEIEVLVHTQKKNGQLFAFGAGDRIANKFFETLRNDLNGDESRK